MTSKRRHVSSSLTDGDDKEENKTDNELELAYTMAVDGDIATVAAAAASSSQPPPTKLAKQDEKEKQEYNLYWKHISTHMIERFTQANQDETVPFLCLAYQLQGLLYEIAWQKAHTKAPSIAAATTVEAVVTAARALANAPVVDIDFVLHTPASLQQLELSLDTDWSSTDTQLLLDDTIADHRHMRLNIKVDRNSYDVWMRGAVKSPLDRSYRYEIVPDAIQWNENQYLYLLQLAQRCTICPQAGGHIKIERINKEDMEEDCPIVLFFLRIVPTSRQWSPMPGVTPLQTHGTHLPNAAAAQAASKTRFIHTACPCFDDDQNEQQNHRHGFYVLESIMQQRFPLICHLTRAASEADGLSYDLKRYPGSLVSLFFQWATECDRDPQGLRMARLWTTVLHNDCDHTERVDAWSTLLGELTREVWSQLPNYPDTSFPLLNGLPRNMWPEYTPLVDRFILHWMRHLQRLRQEKPFTFDMMQACVRMLDVWPREWSVSLRIWLQQAICTTASTSVTTKTT